MRALTLVCANDPFNRNHSYVCFVDPSGGSSDSMTIAVAHKEGQTVVLDAV